MLLQQNLQRFCKVDNTFVRNHIETEEKIEELKCWHKNQSQSLRNSTRRFWKHVLFFSSERSIVSCTDQLCQISKSLLIIQVFL
ncbi:hypothetical protein PsorP6_005408 [Peronosclerospora sorghi]|uniref:Uncharacterized protein n=1 Tax=Peronosclerospora sorghi TaxID=230839 RepID=A0ACC0W4E7_9STRA|nr:hypothetical protein PsorP6_005408 [Peronosclerospora sorghi]